MAESSDQSRKFHNQPKPEYHDINAVSGRSHSNPRQNIGFKPRLPRRVERNPSSNDRFICYSCGRRGHVQGSGECPAKQTKCANCGKVGHWAKRCYSRGQAQKRHQDPPSFGPKPKRIRAVTEETEKDQGKDYIFYAMGQNVFTFKVGGIEIPMNIDSGADANILTKAVWEQMKEEGVDVLEMSANIDRSLIAYASTAPMKICGMFSATIEAGSNKANAKFYVVEDGQQCLLGDHTAKQLQVLKIGFKVNSIQTNLSNPFPKMRGVVMEIPIDEKVQPMQQPYRRPPIAMEEKIEEKLRSLLEQDIIEQVNGPSPWISPVVPVTKDSGEIRLCIDMRQANQAVLREAHPLPLVDELLGSVNGAVRFSKIDI